MFCHNANTVEGIAFSKYFHLMFDMTRQLSIFLRITRTQNVLLAAPLNVNNGTFYLYDSSYAGHDLYRRKPHVRLR